MKINMNLKHNTVDLNEINQCQKRLNVNFPINYRNFSLNQNGGLPTNSLFDYDKTKGSSVYFFGINIDQEYYDLEWNFETYTNRIIPHYIPIGSDSGGKLFV